jgi:ribosomal protein S18 acetylase RimI-like enzyme
MRAPGTQSELEIKMTLPVSFRPAQPDDTAFLYEVYASTRADELRAWGWDQAQQAAFLQMQFTAQQQHYAFMGDEAEQQIILGDGQAIGRLIVIRHERDIVLADIALLPSHRNAGIGTQLIQCLQVEAAQTRRPVRLQVEKSNRARRLYERLGFSIIDDAGVHWQMEWSADETVNRIQRVGGR